MTAGLLERFWKAADDASDRVALATRSDSVTYRTLSRMVWGAAATLRGRVSAGGRVALLSESTPQYAAAVYGSWAADLAVVGLNPALRAEELERLVRHAEVSVLLVDEGLADAGQLVDRVGDAVAVASLDETTAPRAAEIDVQAPAADGLAAIIYTSGTTGHPKGVMLSHANLAANTASIQASLPIDQDDRALCILPFQYSYGSSVLHTHLTLGATVLVERSLMYPTAVLERMESDLVTSFAGVPSTFYLLLDRTDLAAHDLSSLRYVTLAGGRMDPARIQQFRRCVPGADFFVMYGQTEASARLACLPAGDLERKAGSAGKAVSGVELQVRSESGESVEIGRTGEVWARGDNVMKGYWADAEDTNRVLVDGWLRTGDIGHLDSEGYLFLQGRSRDFIKSGAHRIAPGEIEDVIRAVDGVVDVAVVGREDPVLGEAIHAHVVAREPGRALERSIKRSCVQHLARFKLPKEIHFLAELPRTASGKVRKHVL